MALPAIHPGEHLEIELQELKMSAAELAPKACSNKPRHSNLKWHTLDYGRHRSTPRTFFRL